MIDFILLGIIFFLFLWIVFMNAMALQKRLPNYPKPVQYIIKLIIGIGAIGDAIFNIIFGSVLFLELPREWLLTQRLNRILKSDKEYVPEHSVRNKTGAGYFKYTRRYKIAEFICKYFLNPFDPGHCDL